MRKIPFYRLVLGATLLASAGAGAQTGLLYTTVHNDFGDFIFGLQHSGISTSWSQVHGQEMAIAVSGDVRTNWAQYTLNGASTGTAYGGGPGGYDGATDGVFNYGLWYCSVYRSDRDWQHSTQLFSMNVDECLNGYASGITWDPFTNSLWIAANDYLDRTQAISRWSMDGVLQQMFYFGGGYNYGWNGPLAMDYSDGTLWLDVSGPSYPLQKVNTFYQLSTSGVVLDTVTYALGPNEWVYGAEFNYVPEPSTVALLATGLIALIPVARRRQRTA